MAPIRDLEARTSVTRLKDESRLLPGLGRLCAAVNRVTCHMARENLPTGPPSAWAILSGPLPELPLIDRMLVRSMALVSRCKVRSLDGLDHIAPERDPFILAANHSTRQEAIVLPALLFLLRHGRAIHFMADWNFRMIPGVDLLYRRAGAITVARKPARPRLLNLAKPLFTDTVSPMGQPCRTTAAATARRACRSKPAPRSSRLVCPSRPCQEEQPSRKAARCRS